MKKYFDSVIGATGAPIANAAVTVYILSTSTPAALFSDAAGTVSISNPVYTDAIGRFEFYAADGRYSLSINAGGFVIGTVYDILLDDPADASAGVFTNLTVSGTVAGITKAHVGLSGVDNTADASKPISTLAQASLDLKVSKVDSQTQAFTAFPTTGTSAAYTLTTSPVAGTLAADQRYQVTWHTSNTTATPTLTRDGLAVKNIKIYNASGAKINPSVGAFALGMKSDVVFDGTDFVVFGVASSPISNTFQLGSSATDSQNFLLKTNVDGTGKLARGAAGGLGDILAWDANGGVTLPSTVLPGKVIASLYSAARTVVTANADTTVMTLNFTLANTTGVIVDWRTMWGVVSASACQGYMRVMLGAAQKARTQRLHLGNSGAGYSYTIPVSGLTYLGVLSAGSYTISVIWKDENAGIQAAFNPGPADFAAWGQSDSELIIRAA